MHVGWGIALISGKGKLQIMPSSFSTGYCQISVNRPSGWLVTPRFEISSVSAYNEKKNAFIAETIHGEYPRLCRLSRYGSRRQFGLVN